MATIATYACDICGIQKQPSNHWYKLYRVPGGLLVLDWDEGGRAPENADAHVCGSTHAVEWMSREFFGKSKTE